MSESVTVTQDRHPAPTRAQMGAAGALVPVVGALFIGVLGMPLGPALTVGGTFVGVTVAARILAVNAHELTGALGWLAKASAKMWAEWGTGFYGLASLTAFLLKEIPDLVDTGFTLDELLADPISTLIGWLVSQTMEGIVNAISAFFWWMDVVGLTSTYGTWPVVGLVFSGWLFWSLLRIPEAPAAEVDLGLDELVEGWEDEEGQHGRGQ